MTTQSSALESLNNQDTVDIAARIEASPLSDGMKANMRVVHAHLVGVQFGLPQYDLKGTQIWSTMSNFAFVFSIFYYLAKGLWKKAIVLFGISVTISVIIAIISVFLNMEMPFPINSLGALLVSGLSMCSAYSDIYRCKILKQDFWW